MDIKRLQKTLKKINEFGYSDKGLNRIAYSTEEQAALKYIMQEMEDAGMHVRRDAIGNVIARREGVEADSPAVACGSHIDTVYDGGQYDGAVGVVAGLEVVRMLNDEKVETKHPIEIIIFASEESARFGIATIGSKAMTGLIKQDALASLKDKDDISFTDAIKAHGLNIEKLSEVERSEKSVKAFYEVHVEQGIVLEHERKQIGVVSGIAAPTRFELKVCGQAAHSGATPMNLRKDAFLGAAEIALEIERAGRLEQSKGTVATVGSCQVFPGAMNVVPGEASLLVDIRGIDMKSKYNVVEKMKEKIDVISNQRGVDIEYNQLCDDEPVMLNEEIITSVKDTCDKLNLRYKEMPSGAGHDAMNMARKFPTGLIFVPSKGGISHNKDEYTAIEEIMHGVMVLKEEMLKTAEIASLNLVRGEKG